MAPAIEINGLKKVYRSGRGLLGMDLSIPEGEIFGFLGPNGAGKTTTIRTLLGFIRPTGGGARVLGWDIVHDGVALRRQAGYLPGDPALFDTLTGRQHVELSLAVRGVKDRRRVKELAGRLEIELGRPIRQLSRGNRQKVSILLALAHDAPVLMLDEPTTGLDPLMQDTFRQLLKGEQGRGKTIFFSSHVLSEVEAIADRVGIIRDGRLVAVDTVEHLRGKRLKRVTLKFNGDVPDLAQVPGIRDLEVKDNRVQCAVAGSLAPLFRVLADYPGVDTTIVEPSLEEVFRTYYTGVPAS